MKRRFPYKRVKLADLQAAMQMYAPPGGIKNPPAFMDAVPRKQSTEPRKHEESDLQVTCCDYLRTQGRILFFSVPNHIYSKGDPKKVAYYISRQKRLGLLPVVSDLVIIFRNKHGAPTTLFAELKSPKGSLSDSQQAFQDMANDRGCFTGVVRTLEDLLALLKTAEY